MAKVFISYRRGDSASITGRIYDHLAQAWGRDEIFKDVDNIPPGAVFGEYIRQSMRQCTVALVVIGPAWLGSDAVNGRRLDDAKDWVRIEIETAFALGLTVMPVLVEGARMPKAEQLPESLQKLSQINSISVRTDPDFAHDMERLITALGPLVDSRSSPEISRGRRTARQDATTRSPFSRAADDGSRATGPWRNWRPLVALVAAVLVVTSFGVLFSKGLIGNGNRTPAIATSTSQPATATANPQPPDFSRCCLAAYTVDSDASQHLVYFSQSDHVIDVWHSADQGWHYTDVSAAEPDVSPPNTNAGMSVAAYSTSANPTQHVVYLSQSGHLIELWYDATLTPSWRNTDVTLAEPDVSPPASGSHIVAYSTSANPTQHVVYLSQSGHLIELWYDQSLSPSWRNTDLGAAEPSVSPPVDGSHITAYSLNANPTQHVVYLSQSGHLIELWYDATLTPSWRNTDVTAWAAPPLPSCCMAGYSVSADSSQHVVYLTGSNHLIEDRYTPSQGWHYSDLSVEASPPALSCCLVAYSLTADSSQHLVYRSPTGSLVDLSRSGTQGWHSTDLAP